MLVVVSLAAVAGAFALGRVTAPTPPPSQTATYWQGGFARQIAAAIGQQNAQGQTFSEYVRSVLQTGDCSKIDPAARSFRPGNEFWDGDSYRVPIAIRDCAGSLFTVAEVEIRDGSVHAPTSGSEKYLPNRNLWTGFITG